MDFKREVNFQEADRRYAELKRQLDAGTISTEEFDAQRQQLLVQDDEGRWWAKSRETGDWHYHDGEGWVRSTPPGYQPPPADDASDHWSQLEQTESFSSGRQVRDERSPLSQPERNEQQPSQTTSPSSTPTRDQNRGMAQTHVAPVVPPPPAAREVYERRRRRPWARILLLLLLLLALLGGTIYALTRAMNEVPVPPNEGENVEEAEPGAPPPPAVKQQAPLEAPPQQQQQQEQQPQQQQPPVEKGEEQQPQQQQPPVKKGEDDKSKVEP